MLLAPLEKFKENEVVKIYSITGNQDDVLKLAIYGFRPGKCFHILVASPDYIVQDLSSTLTLCIRMDTVKVLCEPYDEY